MPTLARSLLVLVSAVALSSCVAGEPEAIAPASERCVAPRSGEPVPLGSLFNDPEPESAPPAEGRAWLGVELADPVSGPGALVRSVIRGSPAAAAGVQAGDVLIAVDGANVGSPREVIERVAGHGEGDRVSVALLRAGQTRLFAVQLGHFPDPEQMLRLNYVGVAAPRLELSAVQGSVTPTNHDLRGKVVVLEFWASWCPACRLLAPRLNDWHRHFGAQGVIVLGATTDSPSVAANAVSELGISYAVAADPDGTTTTAYSAMALPTLFVLDRQGVVRDVAVGYSDQRIAEIEAVIARLVRE